MHQLIVYLLKVSVCMAVLVCFYQLALRRLTFHTANRFFLLAALVVPFLLALVSPGFFSSSGTTAEPAIIRWVPATESVTSRFVVTTPPQQPVFRFTLNHWLLVTWCAGGLVLVVKLLLSFASIWRLRNRASVVSVNGVEACEVNEPIAPFSFGNKIFLPAGISEGQGLSKILSHELVHVRQWHTADLLLAELASALLWFNPFVWVLRAAIRQNLEFIADNHVISTGVGRREYQLLLLNALGRRSYGMTSQFNLSSLKNRIKMMNKNSNSRIQFLRFVILLPLAAIILLSFRKLNKPSFGKLTYKAVIMDLSSRQPLEGVKLTEAVSGKEVVSDKKGVVELVIEGTGKKELRITYSRNGYINMPSTISLTTKTEEDVAVTELVGIRTGNATDKCEDCFTSLFMGDNTVLQNPKDALEKHLKMKTDGPRAIANIRSTNPDARPAKATINRSANTITITGDSAILKNDGGAIIYNNARVMPLRPTGEYKGLVVLNGRQMDWKQFKAVSDSIEKHQSMGEMVASVSMLNAEQATEKFGDKGAQGAIVIEGKKQ